MSLLPGRFIDKEVAKQIKKRQQVIGSKDRLPLFDEKDPKSYSFFLAKTPFIRLTSGIDKDGLQDPARQSILDNGHRGRGGDVASETPGYEYSDDFGVRPVAGITGMTLNTHNRYGSLRTATVQFEVHSLEQMNLYEEMFMRPGYSALLEWGHSIWLDSETGEVNDMPSLLSEPFIKKSLVSTVLKPGSSDKDIQNQNKQAIYQAIEEMRRRTNFNYDGMYGLIKNFSWSLRPDGGYSCTVDIVSIGTVIESLTINAGITDQEVVKYFNEREISEDEIKPVVEREDETFLEKLASYFGFRKGEDKNNLSETEKAFKDGLEVFVAKSQTESGIITTGGRYNSGVYTVRLKSSLNKNDEKILYNVDVENFTISIRGKWKDVLSNSSTPILPPEQDNVYKIFNNKTFPVNFTDDNGNPKVEFFKVSFVTADLIEDTVVTSVNEFTQKVTDIYNYNFTFRFDNVGSSNPLTTGVAESSIQTTTEEQQQLLASVISAYDTNLPEQGLDALGNPISDDTAVVRGNVADLIKSFNREFNSRVHLTLHLLREDLKREIAESMKGSEATEVYQEVQFQPRTDVPQSHPKYKKLNFPNLTPHLESDYKTGAIRRTLGEETSDTFHYYIQLGTFLDILNVYVPSTKNTDEFLFQYHTDEKTPHVYKTLERLHASVDITKCILPESYGILNYTKRGDILGIFVEIEYLFGLVEKGLVNGDLKGYDIVTEILRDINISVGQINELALQYHEESFTFHIVDRNLVGEEDSEEAVLELIGRNTILRNVTMNSKLSPSISTQIAISAQADPTDNGISGTLFERFNKGLKDRYIPEKKTNLDRLAAQAEEEQKEKQDKLALVFNYLRFVYGSKPFRTQQIAVPGVINEYKLLTSIELGKEGPDRSYGGILPFELGLEIEGISGMQVMDSFLINQNILPKSYVGDGNFGFLITGLTHKVDSNGWITEVKSQIYNRPKGQGRKASTGKFNLNNSEEREFKLVKENHTPWSGPTPNADRVRKINESLGGMQKDLFDQYPEYTYDELSSGADIQPFLADTTISFLRAFKDRFRRYNIRITAGNDVWHHNYARASQHRYGRGLDFTIRDGNRILGGESDRGTLIQISNWASEYFANNSDVFYKDEYSPDRQSNHATGNHFHFHVLKNK